MKVLILNSGIGSRMGDFTQTNPKCMIEIDYGLPLLHYQLKELRNYNFSEIIITTGHLAHVIEAYIEQHFPDLPITFVYNPLYKETNYIYSMNLAADYLTEDFLLLHGDLYFDRDVLSHIFSQKESSVVVDSLLSLPDKDFKARLVDGRIKEISVALSGEGVLACQPFYKILSSDWQVWKSEIQTFCEAGKTGVYAEDALNNILDRLDIRPLDILGKLCMEVDSLDDLSLLKSKLKGE